MVSRIDEVKRPGRDALIQLRQQAVISDRASSGPGRFFRLDPFDFPIHTATVLGEGARQVHATLHLDRDEVVIRRPTPSGLPVTVRVPVSAYEGVAVRMVPIGHDGDIEVRVELRHNDPAISIPLIVAEDPEDVAADWQVWARVLGLPMLVIEQNGTATEVSDRMGALDLLPVKPRRRHSFFAGRRPRFLTRRKTGRGIVLERITAREIIARS